MDYRQQGCSLLWLKSTSNKQKTVFFSKLKAFSQFLSCNCFDFVYFFLLCTVCSRGYVHKYTDLPRVVFWELIKRGKSIAIQGIVIIVCYQYAMQQRKSIAWTCFSFENGGEIEKNSIFELISFHFELLSLYRVASGLFRNQW